jgi:hypothetical protein
MPALNSPFTDTTWQGIARETDLAVQLICSGANEIGRADFASQGRYAAALFGFTNGLERLGKLILTIDNLLTTGKALDDKELRARGHSLGVIFDEVDKIVQRRGLAPFYDRPADDISRAVAACFDDFAAASKGRYANHQTLTGAKSPHDPIVKWWNDVCEPILKKYFRGRAIEARAQSQASQVGSLLASRSIVHFFHEDGSIVSDATVASFMTHERAVTQKWGRFYALRYARWLSEVFTEMTQAAGYSAGTEYLFAHYERLSTFRVEDSFLKARRVWPL